MRAPYPPKPTPFGKDLRPWWGLDPELTYLNHGTVGACPLPVLAAQEQLRRRIQGNPARWLLRELSDLGSPDSPPLLRQAAAQVARHLGSLGQDLVFVDNATTGVNAALRSAELRPGDEVLITDLGYGSVTLAARRICKERGADLRIAHLPVPLHSGLQALEALEAAFGPKTRLLITDHVTSETALVLPVKDISALAHRRGIQVIVDGAHAPGSFALNIPALGADWYAANLHKWAFAPLGCAILWVDPRWQARTEHPIASWGEERSFQLRFDWVGTKDPTPFLCAPEGFRFLEALGSEATWRYTSELAWSSAQQLTQRWGLPFLSERSLVGPMVSVPLPKALGQEAPDAKRLQGQLQRQGIEVPIKALAGQLWARLSLAPYCDAEDVSRFADAVESSV